jgi:ABC-type transporter lipoprotein component MlaA
VASGASPSGRRLAAPAGLALCVAALGLCLASACASRPEAAPELSNSALLGNDALYAPRHREGFSVLVYTQDPLEPANRASLRLTKGLLDFLVQPLALGYRALVPEPARRSLDRAHYNLRFPDRLVSLVLQGRVRDGAEESGRFLVNTVVGFAGLLDPAARLGLDTFSEDVGQAFGKWGIGSGPYLFLPLLGPSNARDLVGRVFDTALDPASYLLGLSPALAFNTFSLRVDDYRDLSASEADWYVPIRTLWAIRREAEVEDYTIPPSAFAASDPEPSLGVLRLALSDPAFARRASERRVPLPGRGVKLRYSLWLQPEPAPLVFLLPGIGAHRRGTTTVAMAELAFAQGFSVAALSSAFHPEVQLTALRSPYPGYTPHDAEDLAAALEAIHAQLAECHPGRVTGASLLGLSLGALEALHIAAGSAAGADAPAAAGSDGCGSPGSAGPRPGALRFERIVAVSPPVDVASAARRFDEYFDAPLRWPEAERDARVLELGKKAVVLATRGLGDARLPFDRIESQFLIGLNSRDVVHNALVAIRRRTGRGLAFQPADDPERGPLLEEVNRSSFSAYVEQVVLPPLRAGAPEPTTIDTLLARAGLREIGPALARDPRVRVVANADDFLLAPEQLRWLRETLGERVTLFPSGGHLGNLWAPDVQAAIAAALDARAAPPRGEPADPARGR